MMVDGVVETPNGAHFTTCTPDYERDEGFQRAYAAAAGGTDEEWAAFERAVPRPATRRRTRPPSPPSPRSRHERPPTRADVCAAAIADAFADDGEIFASPMGLLPMLGVRLAKLTSNPDLVISDGESLFLAGAPAARSPRGRRRGLDPVPPGLRRRRLRQAARDDGRHPGRPAGQPEHLRHRRLRAAEAAAARGPRRPGQHRQQPDVATGCRSTPRASSSSRSTSSPASGPTRAKAGRPGRHPLPRHPPRRQRTSASSTSHGPGDTLRLLSVHPGVTVDEVRDGHRLRRSHVDADGDVPETREPTAEELVLIREVLDPKGLRDQRGARRSDRPQLLAHAVHRPGRRPPPGRADRHGLGRRPAAGRRHGERRRARHPGQRHDDLRGARAGDRSRSRAAPTSRSGSTCAPTPATPPSAVDLLIKHGVKVASFALAPKPELIAQLKDHGVVVMPSIGAARHAE